MPADAVVAWFGAKGSGPERAGGRGPAPMDSATAAVLGWRGDEVVDRDGERIGELYEVYLDDRSLRPEWALVVMGLLGAKWRLVPLAGARSEPEKARVGYSKARIADAPAVTAESRISPEMVAGLRAHYGV